MTRPSLSVLIPAYNEAGTLERCVLRVEEACRGAGIDAELILVDDGSSDGTRELMNEIASSRDPARFTVLQHPENRGKGAAIRTGLPCCSGIVTLIQDADLEYDPADYPLLVRPILNGEADVVYGSRRLHPERDYPIDRHLIGSMVLTVTANILYGLNITDEPTCYKAFRTSLLQSLPLQCEGFEFCPEVTARVALAGHPILEVPIRYDKRSIADGKKIRWHDAVVAMWTLVRLRIGT